MNIQLAGRRALITGGNTGIGAAVTRAFSAAGAKVAIDYVAHSKAAEALCNDIEQRGGEALAIEADVSQPDQVRNMFAQIDEAWGGLDILVNNAAVSGRRELGWEVRLEDWRAVIEVNLYGAFYCAQEALRRMIPAASGTIINITSVQELMPQPGYSAYAASKAGLGMLTKALAQEAVSHGVRVLALAPGAIGSSGDGLDREKNAPFGEMLKRLPAERLGTAEDVAHVAVLMASDAARHVTGTSVVIDGGLTLFVSSLENE